MQIVKDTKFYGLVGIHQIAHVAIVEAYDLYLVVLVQKKLFLFFFGNTELTIVVEDEEVGCFFKGTKVHVKNPLEFMVPKSKAKYQ